MNESKVFVYWISPRSGCLVSSTDPTKAEGEAFVTHVDYRALEEQAAKDTLDAERWRWLVAENNKGGSRAKFLICWWSKDGDGYESTTGTSVDGHDPETIVRLIDNARTPKEQTK